MRKFPGEENHNDRHVTESLPEKEDWKDVLAHYEVLAAQSLGQRQAKRELATMWQRLWSARTGECATTVTVAQMAMLGKLRDELEIQKIAEIVGNWSDYVLHVRDVDGTYKGPSDPNLKFLVGHLQAAITFKAPEEEPPEGVELKFQHFERATS